MNYKLLLLTAATFITSFISTAQWVNIPGSLTKISGASLSQIAGLDASNNVYKFNTATVSWDTLPNASLIEISINSNGTIWGIGPTINPVGNSNVYRFKNNMWTVPTDGAVLSKISMIGDSLGYGVNPNPTNNIYHYNGTNWFVLPGNGSLKHISIGGNASLWGIGPSIHPTLNSNVYVYNTINQTWTIPNNGIILTKLVTADSSRMIGIDNNGTLYKRNNLIWTAIPSLTNVKDISIANDGTIFCLTNASSNNIYRSHWDSLNISAVGVNEQEILNSISLFPNPANSNIQLSNLTNIKSLELINTLGHVTKVTPDVYSNIDISTFPCGIYYIKVVNTGGQTKILKFSKI